VRQVTCDKKIYLGQFGRLQVQDGAGPWVWFLVRVLWLLQIMMGVMWEEEITTPNKKPENLVVCSY
jgi:hypothetical protein